VLHIWDQAGVAALMAEHQRIIGHEAKVIKRSGFDKCGIDEFYGTECLDVSVWRFYRTARTLSKSVDILHIHSLYKTCLFTPFSKKILEYHGSDIRTYDSLLNRICRKALRKIVVSTPDLLSLVDAVWLPNPVDTKHFRSNTKNRSAGALYVHNWYEDKAWAEEWAKEKKIELTILDRANNFVMQYADMPDLLNRYTYFLDRKAINSTSKLALEALSCGLKVVCGNGQILEGLPDYHKPENVAKASLKIYEEILE